MLHKTRTDYRTLVKGTEVFFRCERPTPQEQSYLMGLAENVGLGGLFVAVHQPPAPGAVLHLRLYRADDGDMAAPLCAKAIVRWRRLWGKPRGMGIQFLEFAGLGERGLDSWLSTMAAGGAMLPKAARVGGGMMAATS